MNELPKCLIQELKDIDSEESHKPFSTNTWNIIGFNNGIRWAFTILKGAGYHSKEECLLIKKDREIGWKSLEDWQKAREQLVKFAKEYGLGCDDWLIKIGEVFGR